MTQADQMSIFDAIPPHIPRAHRNDPISSQYAAAEGERSGRFKSNATLVLAALKARPGSTSAELAAHMGMDVHEVRRRLTDLADQRVNLARRIDPFPDMAPCATTYKRACRWEPL